MYMYRERKMKEMVVGSSSEVEVEEGDTRYRKIFVGGLAWATQTDSMKAYFDQFGHIVEAVVISDKHTQRSKGYGFVTFKDPNSAIKACENPYPVIDGRRANCNLAAFGPHHHKNPTNNAQRGLWKVKSSTMGVARPASNSLGVSTYNCQPYAYPYGAYGYPNYQQDIYTLNYYYNNASYGVNGQLQDFPAQYVIGSPNELYFTWYQNHLQHPLLPFSTINPKTTQGATTTVNAASPLLGTTSHSQHT
ncbi:hypothetical protein CsatB_002292 [Cannabis sativa]